MNTVVAPAMTTFGQTAIPAAAGSLGFTDALLSAVAVVVILFLLRQAAALMRTGLSLLTQSIRALALVGFSIFIVVLLIALPVAANLLGRG